MCIIRGYFNNIKQEGIMAFVRKKASPSCFVANKGEESVKAALLLTSAKRRFVVRITGGCGYMSTEDAQGMESLFADAFRGYAGGIIYGGTRMYDRQERPLRVVPGITEIVPRIRDENEGVVTLGITPRRSDIVFHPEFGLVVTDGPEEDYVTVVHPDQDSCLIVQKSVDKGADWIDEAYESQSIVDHLRTFAKFDSLLLCYNGGSVTEQEILFTAENGWPVLLVRGSGRKSDEYANDTRFLTKHPNVCVAENNILSIRRQLYLLGALDEDVMSAEMLRMIQ